MMKRLRILLLCMALPLAAWATNDPLTVRNAWIKQLPPVVPVRAGYVTLVNNGKQPLRLVAVSGEDFARVELHETELVDGTMRMLQRDAFDIPAGGALELKPGGKHLMLFDPARPLSAGDSTELLLEFDDGSSVRQAFEIRP